MQRNDRKMVVMVVEDDALVAEVATTLIDSLGYDVFWCRSVGDAMERIHHCDLVFADILLPGKSGLELIEWIRAEGVDIPILATSGNHTQLAQAMFAGANAVIPKPWLTDVLKSWF